MQARSQFQSSLWPATTTLRPCDVTQAYVLVNRVRVDVRVQRFDRLLRLDIAAHSLPVAALRHRAWTPVLKAVLLLPLIQLLKPLIWTHVQGTYKYF
jgi:hypothetical protein